MSVYVVLLRGINVGGRNIMPMTALRSCLEGLGFENVSTHIASGNVILTSSQDPGSIAPRIEAGLMKAFALDSELVKVLALSRRELQDIVERKPPGFGDRPATYHSDVIFLMGIDAAQAMAAFDPRDGVDTVWSGNGVIYSQRLSERRTQSRLNKVMGSPLYKAMTIRSWNTTVALLEKARVLDT